MESIGDRERARWVGMYYKVTAPVMMEAGKSHTCSLWESCCRSCRAREPESWWGRSHCASEGLRTRSVKGRGRSLSQLSLAERARIQPTFLCLFCSTLQRTGWYPLTMGRAIGFTQAYLIKCLSLPETLPQTHPEIIQPDTWKSQDLVKQMHKINYHSTFVALHNFEF